MSTIVYFPLAPCIATTSSPTFASPFNVHIVVSSVSSLSISLLAISNFVIIFLYVFVFFLRAFNSLTIQESTLIVVCLLLVNPLLIVAPYDLLCIVYKVYLIMY